MPEEKREMKAIPMTSSALSESVILSGIMNSLQPSPVFGLIMCSGSSTATYKKASKSNRSTPNILQI